MFIGRTRELAALNECYASERFEFAVIYGRRRVGKTALITRFIAGKRAIYLTGVEGNAKQNLENFSRGILESSADIREGTSFLSFQDALTYVFRMAETERIVLIIDEYPYAARAEQSLTSTLQMIIDRNQKNSKLMLILCGSSMSYMEDHVLAYKAPLYGRRTMQLKLLPFDFADACRCCAGFTPPDQALIYGIMGGTPQYLLQIDDRLSVADNIKNTFFNASSTLFEEPGNLLKQEVREAALYNSVIGAIAGGASRMAEIAGKVGVQTSVCDSYLKNLVRLGLIERETPYGEKASRKSIYMIADNMFRFWYRFVPEHLSIIARGGAEVVYRRIAAQLPTYMGPVFEEICRQYLWLLLLDGASPVAFVSLGRWWGTDPVRKRQTEIDIMGAQDKDSALFAECKWTNEKVDVGVLQRLVERSRMFRYQQTHLFLFAKSGFTKGCIDAAATEGNVTLVTYAEMLRKMVP